MKRLQDDESHADMTVDEIIGLGIRLSKCVIGVYESVAESSEPESVKDAFANLLNLEQKALEQFARDAGRLADL